MSVFIKTLLKTFSVTFILLVFKTVITCKRWKGTYLKKVQKKIDWWIQGKGEKSASLHIVYVTKLRRRNLIYYDFYILTDYVADNYSLWRFFPFVSCTVMQTVWKTWSPLKFGYCFQRYMRVSSNTKRPFVRLLIPKPCCYCSILQILWHVSPFISWGVI